jgi:hypothetical protein
MREMSKLGWLISLVNYSIWADSLQYSVQLGHLEVTVQEKVRSGWPGPFVKVEGCCD